MDLLKSPFRHDCLAGRVAFITGGATGVGKGIARILMQHGVDTIIASRNIKKLQTTAKELQSITGQRCTPAQMDVRKPSEIASAVDHALESHGHIDILVNCAAGNFLCPLDKLSINGFRSVMEIDAHGSFMVSKIIFDKCFRTAYAEEISQSPHGEDDASSRRRSFGKIIINISASLYHCGTLLQTHAGAAKAAVDAMTKHMAVEWGPYNVRVNSITPGPIDGTVGFEKLIASPSANRKTDPEHGGTSTALTNFMPLQRIGHPEDIGFMTLFLCHPVASFITGANIFVDGGQILTAGNFTVLDPTINHQWRTAPFKAKL